MIFCLQVLSDYKALPLVVGEKALETAKFASTFDLFFDVLNVTEHVTESRSNIPIVTKRT